MQGLQRRQFSAWAVASALSSPMASGASITPQKVSIALAAKGALFHLPVVLADQLGIYKHEGLQIEWVECDSGLQAVNMALAGQADVVSGVFEHIIDLQARGLNYRAFVMQGRTPQISLGLSMRRAQVMKSVADLKGLKMGVTSLGSATHWVAQHWMRQAGLVADHVQFVELGASTANVMEAMRMGSIDALCFTDPVIHYLEQKGELRILSETRTLSSSQRMFGGPMVSACLFAKDDFLNKRPDAAQTLAQGVLKALNWLKTAGPSDILKTIPTHYWMGDRALYLSALDKVRDSYSLYGSFSRDALETAWKARASRVTTSRANWTTLNQSYTNEFVKVFKKRNAS
jgi:NitT/TauT family transport system substrate-binding protein